MGCVSFIASCTFDLVKKESVVSKNSADDVVGSKSPEGWMSVRSQSVVATHVALNKASALSSLVMHSFPALSIRVVIRGDGFDPAAYRLA